MFESVLDSFRHDDAFLDRLETVATEIRDTANAKGVISVQAADLQRFMTNPEGLQKSTKIWDDMRTFAPEVGSRLAEKEAARARRRSSTSSTTGGGGAASSSSGGSAPSKKKLGHTELVKFLKPLHNRGHGLDPRAICAEFFPSQCTLKGVYGSSRHK